MTAPTIADAIREAEEALASVAGRYLSPVERDLHDALADALAALKEPAPAAGDAVREAVIEAMAAVEHERWSGWYRHQRDNSTTERIARWDTLAATPYDDLTEELKEKDRVEARRSFDAALLAALREQSPAPCPDCNGTGSVDAGAFVSGGEICAATEPCHCSPAPAPAPPAPAYPTTIIETILWVLNDAHYKAPEQIAGLWREVWAPKLREAVDAMPVGTPAPAEVADRRADVLGRLVKSFDTMEELRRWTNAEIADLLSKHWMEIDGLSAASDLVAEVLDRLRGLKTCPECAGYGYLDHVRCARCEGTGDVAPAPADQCGALRRCEVRQ